MLLTALLYWIMTAVMLLAVDAILPGVSIANFWTALLAALVMGLVNFFIRPILSLLTLPLNLLTLGLFTFVLNAFLFELVAWMVNGFVVDTFLDALLGSLLVSIMSSLLAMFMGERGRIA